MKANPPKVTNRRGDLPCKFADHHRASATPINVTAGHPGKCDGQRRCGGPGCSSINALDVRAVVVTVIVVVDPAATEAGLNNALPPGGSPVAVNVT